MNKQLYIIAYVRKNVVKKRVRIEVKFNLGQVKRFCNNPNRSIKSVISYDFETRQKTEVKWNVT